MTNNERDGFKALMDALCERFGRQPMGPVTVAMSFAVIQDELPDVTLTELTAAVKHLLKTAKFMPTDADLIDAVNNDRDRNLAPCHQTFSLPPRVETDEETKQAMQEALQRIRACASKVGKRMPSFDDPWEDAPWTDPRTPEQVAASRAEIAEQLASMTRRND